MSGVVSGSGPESTRVTARPSRDVLESTVRDPASVPDIDQPLPAVSEVITFSLNVTRTVVADVATTPAIDGAMPSSTGRTTRPPPIRFPAASDIFARLPRAVPVHDGPKEPHPCETNVRVSALEIRPPELPFPQEKFWENCTNGPNAVSLMFSVYLKTTLFGATVVMETFGATPSDIGMPARASRALDDESVMAPEPEPESAPTSEPDVS